MFRPQIASLNTEIVVVVQVPFSGRKCRTARLTEESNPYSDALSDSINEKAKSFRKDLEALLGQYCLAFLEILYW